MFDRPDVSLGTRRTTHGVVFVDRSCGRCETCRSGAPLWCQTPAADGRELSPPVPAERAAQIGDALLAVAGIDAAVRVTTTAGSALVLRQLDGPAATLARALAEVPVVIAPEPSAARELLSHEPTGRARVVVAGTDARAAVRAVRRGGAVCLTGVRTALPSVTEVVQREVTLVTPRDVAAVAGRVDDELWAAAIAAA